MRIAELQPFVLADVSENILNRGNQSNELNDEARVIFRIET